MNEGDSHLHPWIEPELEARIIALVLGEASDFEAEELERLMGEQSELAMFRKRMAAIHGLLHEVAEGESEDADDSWKLPKDRRETVLAAIEGREQKSDGDSDGESEGELEEEAGTEIGDAIEQPAVAVALSVSKEAKEAGKRRERNWKRVVSFAAAAGLILFVGVASVFFYSMLGQSEDSAGSSYGIALARPEEEYDLAQDAAITAIRQIREAEDTPVLPQRWWGTTDSAADMPTTVVAVTDGVSATADPAALSYDVESAASSSLGRLKGTVGNINILTGVDSGLTVVSGLDVDSRRFLSEQRETAKSGSGPDASNLQMPKTDSLVRGTMPKDLVGDIQVTTGNDLNIRAYSTPDMSEPVSTAGKVNLAFPEMPGDAGGDGGRELDSLANTTATSDLNGLAFFDVRGSEQDAKKDQPVGDQPQGQSRGESPPSSTVTNFEIAGVAGKPANQPAGAVESEVIDESLMGGTVSRVRLGGSAPTIISVDGTVSVSGPAGSGGTVTLEEEFLDAPAGGNMTYTNGRSDDNGDGQRDLEELEERSKRKLAESTDWAQVGGSFARPGNALSAFNESAAPMPTAKPKPSAAPEARELKTSTKAGGLVEISGTTNLRSTLPVESPMGGGGGGGGDGTVLFDPGAVVAGKPVGDPMFRDGDSEGDGGRVMPATKLPTVTMQSLGAKAVDLAQVELQKSEPPPNPDSPSAAEKSPSEDDEYRGRQMNLAGAGSKPERARDKVPVVGDLPATGMLFKATGRAGAEQVPSGGAPPAPSEAKPSKLADLTTPMPVRDGQPFGDFDNGMGNSVDGAYVDKPDEGNSHSLNGGDVFFAREFRGGANNLRGFDFAEVAPKAADSPEPGKGMGLEFKSKGNDLEFKVEEESKEESVQITTKFVEVEPLNSELGFDWLLNENSKGGGAAPSSGPAPANRPVLTKNLEEGKAEQLLHKGHGQVSPIEITGNVKTKDQAIRRELAVPSEPHHQGQISNANLLAKEQFGAGGYDTVREFEPREKDLSRLESLSQTAPTDAKMEDANAPVGGAERLSQYSARSRSVDGSAANQKGPGDGTLELNSNPEVVDFAGFVNYGSPTEPDALGAITEAQKSESQRMPARKGSGDDALALEGLDVANGAVTVTAGGVIDVSGAIMGGESVTVGGGFQGRNAGGREGGRVTLGAAETSPDTDRWMSQPGAITSQRGSIRANSTNGAGGEVRLNAEREQNVPQQSLAAIKDVLKVAPNADGAAVNWDSFSLSAGETSHFTQPGEKGRGLNRVISGQELYNGISANGGQVAATPGSVEMTAKSTMESLGKLVPRVVGGGSIEGTVVNPQAKVESDEFFSKDFQTAGPASASIANVVPPVQHEGQRHPAHPATTQPAPVTGEGEIGQAVQWTNSQTSFGAIASGNVNVDTHIRTSGSGSINLMAGWTGDESDLREFGNAEPAFRADINVALTGGLLQQSGGRLEDYRQIGHGGYSASGWASDQNSAGSTRQWHEGFGENQGGVGAPNGTIAFGAGGEFMVDTNGDSLMSTLQSGTRSGSKAIDGDSIDGLIASGAAKDYSNYSRDNTRAKFQRGVNEGWELPVPVTSRGGEREKIEVNREFSYRTEYDPPELPNSVDQQIRFSTEIGATSEDGKQQYHFQRQARAKRVAPPSGLEEKNAAEESFSTFSLHVSDVSFKLAQAALAKGEWPEAGKVRIEEFVNAFDYGDPNPSQDDKVACVVEQAIHPFLQQRNLMRVAMRTAAAGRAGDTPLRLTFLLDNSGSMERADREETVRRAFALLADQLQPIDQVTLISFARQPRLLADKVSGDQSRNLVEVVANLPSEGGTNLEAALQLAFEKAREQKADKAQNRIVLLTDGAANLGNAKPESLAAMVESMREEGIAFDAAGIGADGLNDDILEALTRKGDGRYYLLDRPDDADSGFARQIAGALRPAAKNVKVQVEFNPDRVGNYKLLGFEKHLLKKEDFRDDSVDAAEMAAEEAGVAVYQFEVKPDGKGDIGFVSVRFRDMSSGEMVEKRWPIPYEPSAPRPDQAAPSMQIATAAALLAAKLNSEPLGETVDLGELARTVSSLPESYQNKERVQQLRQMIGQARELAAK